MLGAHALPFRGLGWPECQTPTPTPSAPAADKEKLQDGLLSPCCTAERHSMTHPSVFDGVLEVDGSSLPDSQVKCISCCDHLQAAAACGMNPRVHWLRPAVRCASFIKVTFKTAMA